MFVLDVARGSEGAISEVRGRVCRLRMRTRVVADRCCTSSSVLIAGGPLFETRRFKASIKNGRWLQNGE